jgi:RNA polymerase sigma-70 factor (ECF subfamily)
MHGLETTWIGALAGRERDVPFRRPRALRLAVVTPPETQAAPDGDQLGDLVEAIARRGDREAFATLFQLTAPRVKGYLVRLGLPAAAAEELAQETLLMVWRKAELFDRSKAGAATWIFTIARNLRISAARREQTALAYAVNVLDEPEPPEQPDALAGDAERDRVVAAAIETLTPEQAMVLRLSFYQDKAHGEIAEDLGIPLGTVKSRMRLALARLRKALEHLK